MRSEDETTLKEINAKLVDHARALMKFYRVKKPMDCFLRALEDFVNNGERLSFTGLDGETVVFNERDDIARCLLEAEEYFCIVADEEKKKKEKTGEESGQVQLDVAELSIIRSRGGERRDAEKKEV